MIQGLKGSEHLEVKMTKMSMTKLDFTWVDCEKDNFFLLQSQLVLTSLNMFKKLGVEVVLNNPTYTQACV